MRVGVEARARGSMAASTSRQPRSVVDGVEERRLVLLQVAVVGERQALQRGQQRDQVAEHAARSCRAPARRRRGSSSAASSSCRSRRRRAASTKPNSLDRPEHELLGEPRRGARRAIARGGEELDDEVAVGDRVEAVAALTRAKPSSRATQRAVERERRCRRARRRRAAARRRARGSRRSARGRARASRGRRAGGARAAPAARAAGACSPA